MTSHLLWPPGRFIGCAYNAYYPEGAFNDVVGSYDTLELALEDLAHHNYDIRYVIDSQTGEVTNFQVKP